MHPELRIPGPSYRFWAHFVDEAQPDRPTSFAFPNLDPQSGFCEYIVLPENANRRRQDTGIPVFLRRAERNGSNHQPALFPPPRIPFAPPYIVVRVARSGAPSAVLHGSSGTLVPFTKVVLVGPGERAIPRGFRRRRRPSHRELSEGPWSRTIGAFGGDDEALDRIQLARYTLIGCGRNGMLLAQHLAAMGVIGPITLIDDDVVEEHSIQAMGIGRRWIGTPKIDATEAMILRMHPAATVVKMYRSAGSAVAIRAMAQSDLILSAVDHGEGRLIAATAGAAYLRPVLDVGSAVAFAWRERGWNAGVDVRLTGFEECLVCLGGVPDLDAPRDRDWRLQRAGSLRSINSIATGIAQVLLERHFSFDSVRSTWVRLTFDATGRVDSRVVPSAGLPGACPICAVSAMGDEVFFAQRDEGEFEPPRAS